jgi:cardiolipin synthase
VIALIYGDYRYALIIFLTASITDVLDGLFARLTKQITVFGSILDPVADKFLLITAFVIMGIFEWIPKWFTTIVLSRELIILTGWVILYFVTRNPKVEPSILGKVTNASQFILIALILLVRNINGTFSIPTLFFTSIAVLTTLSGIHYIYMGLKIANTNTE